MRVISSGALFVFFLPLVMAECPAEAPPPLPDPGKCFTCPGSGTRLNKPESWTDFYCKHTTYEHLDDPEQDKKHDGRKDTLCYYNEKGELIEVKPSGASCAKSIPLNAGCEQVKKPAYPGPYEKCCGDNCKYETDKCFYCPKQDGTAWVDVTVKEDRLDCIYHFSGEGRRDVIICDFYLNNGTLISRYPLQTCASGTVAPQREECLKNNPSAKVEPEKDVLCAEGPGKAECEQKKYTRCQSIRGKCSTDDCWTCPKKSGTTFVEAYGFEHGYKFQCKYDDGKSSSDCAYKRKGGGFTQKDDRGNDVSFGSCPNNAEKDLECVRLKGN